MNYKDFCKFFREEQDKATALAREVVRTAHERKVRIPMLVRSLCEEYAEDETALPSVVHMMADTSEGCLMAASRRDRGGERMSNFTVTYMSTDELDKLGYPSKIQVRKGGGESVREYRPADVALIQKTEGGQLRCSCCGRQLKRDYISGWKRGWRYCVGCGARIMGTED